MKIVDVLVFVSVKVRDVGKICCSFSRSRSKQFLVVFGPRSNVPELDFFFLIANDVF